MSELLKQIEGLSPENQTRVADYIAFLQWQEQQGEQLRRADWSFSFIEAYPEAAIHASHSPAGMDVKMAPASVGGETRPALWAHPPLEGQTILEYHVPIPQQIGQVRLRLAIGIRDGAKIAENNLVAFSVRVNGLRQWGRQSNLHQWQEAEIPLNLVSGDMARIEFTTEALNGHEWTWAVWGNPELVGLQKSA